MLDGTFKFYKFLLPRSEEVWIFFIFTHVCYDYLRGKTKTYIFSYFTSRNDGFIQKATVISRFYLSLLQKLKEQLQYLASCMYSGWFVFFVHPQIDFYKYSYR